VLRGGVEKGRVGWEGKERGGEEGMGRGKYASMALGGRWAPLATTIRYDDF